MNDHISFTLNEPQVVKLSDPVPDRDGCNWVFKTDSGKCLELPRVAAQQIAALQVEPGEEISIARYRKDTKEPAEWVVSLTPRTEQARAGREASELEKQLAESLKQTANLRKMPNSAISPASEPSEAPRGTGTYGPAPIAARSPRNRQCDPIPFDVAFREVVRFVSKELNESGEQWSEQSRQDLTSTVLIAAAKQGLLGVWQR